MMKFEKGSKEWNMMADFYRTCEKFWVAENSDQYWDGLLDATEALNQKYKNPTLLSLLVGFIEAKEKDYCDLTGRTRRPATMKWERVER